MAKTHATPDEIGEALALREAGYTTLVISQRFGISVRTLQRHFAAVGARKGAVKAEVLRKAKDELLARMTSDQTIKDEAARLVADDLAPLYPPPGSNLAASEQMKAESLRDAVQVMQAAAAYSTAIKNTSDIIRRSLRLEDHDGASDERPELVITELTQAEIEQLRCKDTPEDKPAPDEELVDEAIMLA